MAQKTLGIRNCNPFNIKNNIKNKWIGQINFGTKDNFAKFSDMNYGMRAGFVIITNYLKSGYNTIEKIINRFAPPVENSTSSYISYIENSMKIGHNESLFDYAVRLDVSVLYAICSLCRFIMKFESNYDVSIQDVLDVYKKYFIGYSGYEEKGFI